MKKILSAFLIVFILVILSSCGNNSNDENSDEVKYKVTWVSDGKTLKEDEVLQNTIPTYTGETPIKESTAKYSYTFTGWSPQITACNSDITYTAVFEEVINKYSIVFDSNGGSNVESITADYMTSIAKPSDPVRDNYKFVSWCYDRECQNAVVWPISLEKDITLYAKWNEKIDISFYLEQALNNYSFDPYDVIPASLNPNKNNVAVNNLDYNNFVNVSNIQTGYAEQWNMVLNNLEQTKIFMNVLNAIDAVASSSIVAFNNYLDRNPSDTANYTFKYGQYDIGIIYEDNILRYSLSFTTDIAILGQINPRIDLVFNISTNEKTVRIQLTDDNVLKYNITNDSYTFAITYLGVRKAYFNLDFHDENNITGDIYEFLYVESLTYSSCATFIIRDDYASITGNKASGIVGFSGVINEVYDCKTGKLLAYEIEESLSAIVYNTLWFNLDSINNLTNIKAVKSEEVGLNEYNIYINDSNDIFKTKKFGGLNLKNQSRRYDIEMRKQYIYTYDSINNKVIENEILTPMLFVQQEVLADFSADVIAMNNESLEILLPLEQINYIISDYQLNVAAFKEIKDLITIDYITEYLN